MEILNLKFGPAIGLLGILPLISIGWSFFPGEDIKRVRVCGHSSPFRMAFRLSLQAWCSSFQVLLSLKDVDDFHLRSVGRALEYMIREYRDCLELVERHSSLDTRRVEDLRVEDRRESVRVEESVAEKKSCLPPPRKKSRKSKVCSSGFSSLPSTSDVALAPPESESVEVLPPPPSSSGGEYSTIDELLKSLG